MADTATTLTGYPLFDMNNGLNLRVFHSGFDRGRHADAAATARALIAADRRVVVATSNPPAVRDLAGLDSRRADGPDRFDCREHRNLVSLTAAVYDAWSTGERIAVIVDNFTTVDTGPHREHLDLVATTWATAVALGAADTIESITGLSYTGYLQDDTPPAPTPAIVIVHTQARRDAPPTDLSKVMGGTELRATAASITAVSNEPAASTPGTVRATATVLKPTGRPDAVVEIERPRDRHPGFWRPTR